jgi:AraC family ethanolamine operon transcriptional activator
MNSNASFPNQCEAPQPAVTVVEITDPTAVNDSIEILDQDVVQITPKPLRIKRVIVRLGSSLLVYHSTNLPVRTRTSISADLICFVSFGTKTRGTVNGLSIRPDLLLTAEPGLEAEFVTQKDYESIAIFHPPSSLQNDLEIRQREDEFRLPQGIEVLQSAPSAAQLLFKKAKSIIESAAQHPELFEDHPITRQTAHLELLETLLEALGSARHYQPLQKERTRQSYSQTIQTAEDYAMNHTVERVSVTDLCKVCHVSERTLQYAFKKIMGMTPIGYLNRLRLHRVREELRNTADEKGAVSSAAIRWGFWHFGDFSQAYKSCFGELPSDTVKEGKI